MVGITEEDQARLAVVEPAQIGGPALLPDLKVQPKPSVVRLPVMSRHDRLIVAGFSAAWLAANVVFWVWWLQPQHVVTIPRFVIASLALGYDLTLMPAFFLFFLFKMRRPAPIEPPIGMRVAMVTAIVPSVEALDVLERTLIGMTANIYSHDSWVLDEGGDPRVVDLCQRYGVHYWTRHGIPELNQPHWPLQAKTKSGNYNGWLGAIGYEHYDFMVQLDTDHVPVPDYLDRVLGYFEDDSIAYVALPSVYSNLDDWPARGSSEQSQIFQGPMQMGYYGWANSPMIIGSHAAYRLEHLREIRGFGPSRAEDHLDTLNLVKAGYQGVFLPENLAFGLGPHTLADYMVQEHQWAFSIAQVFMKYSRGAGKLSLRQRSLFLFSELWYSIFALSYFTLYLLPLVALLTNTPIVSVPFLAFVLYSQPIIIVSLIAVAWCHRRGWFRPGTHRFISWQGIILTMARWPIVLVAIVNAIISVALRGGAFRYMVTPKGNRSVSSRYSMRVARQFIIMATIPSAVVAIYPWLAAGSDYAASGYIVFALMSSLLYGLLVVAVALDHIRVNRIAGIRTRQAWAGAAPILLICLLILFGVGGGALANHERARTALTHWPELDNDQRIAIATSVPEPGVTPTEVVVTPTIEAPTEPVGPLPVVNSWLFDTSRSGVTFGAYDPGGTLASMSNLTHLYTSWNADGAGGVPVELIRASHERGVPVMLSLEPHPIEELSRDDLLSDIITGRYDSVIRDAARASAGLESPILIRFAHEMDLAGLYPWAGDEPARYISAWTRVVQLFRQEGATNAIWVWSPGGTLDSPSYYPGPAWVDYVGMTVLQYTGWELDAGYAEPRAFQELIHEKYHLLGNLGKPLIIAEAGISLDSDRKQVAVRQMIEILPLFPKIRAVVYFNDRNPETSITNERPDWRLGPAELQLLRSAIADNLIIEPRTGDTNR